MANRWRADRLADPHGGVESRHLCREHAKAAAPGRGGNRTHCMGILSDERKASLLGTSPTVSIGFRAYNLGTNLHPNAFAKDAHNLICRSYLCVLMARIQSTAACSTRALSQKKESGGIPKDEEE